MKKEKRSLAVLLAFVLLLGMGVSATASETYRSGDVNGDDLITPEDARLTLRASVGLECFTEGSVQFLAADVNQDGKIGSDDARLILRASVGLEQLEKPAKETLVMGTEASFPPYEFVGEDGSYSGIDVEIADAVAEKLGMTLEIRDMSFDSLIPAVVGGSVDMVLAAITATPEREEVVLFSRPYMTNTQVVLTRRVGSIRSVDDLFDAPNIKIGVVAGTTGDIYATGDFGQENVRAFQSGSDAAKALRYGQVDAVIIDQTVAWDLAAADNSLTVLQTEYTAEQYAAAFAKGNTALCDRFNAAIEELIADGTVMTIIEKYISAVK